MESKPGGVGPVRADRIVRADNLRVLRGLPDGCCDLIYVDPPFVPGKDFGPTPWTVDPPVKGMRAGSDLGELLTFLGPRFEQMHRVLSERGSLYVHLDWRSVHHVKVMLDGLFGSGNFLNEIIWSYRTGGRSSRWFARKHDTLLLYARRAGRHTFHLPHEGTFRTLGLHWDEDDRPYKVTRKGRLYFHPDGPAMTDVWEIPFLSTVSNERCGYPCQKPEALLERIIRASSNEGDLVADFFCGSGTTLAAAKGLGRRYLGCDVNERAVAIARNRVARLGAAKPLQRKTPEERG